MPRLTIYMIASVIAFLVSPSQTPTMRFVKHERAIPHRYIVVLNDDVVPNDAPLERRRALVTAIASRHAKTYGGKVDYIYETALKGYAIVLPNEAAAVAISKLPQVKFVEEDALGTWSQPDVLMRSPSQSLCRGKSVSVSLLDIPGRPKFSEPRQTSLLHGGILERSRLVIRNGDEFQQLWKQLLGAGSYQPPAPEIDFSRDMIVVAAMGQKPSSGYEIFIDGACEVDNQLEVFVRSFDSLKCGVQLAVLTEPVDIVRVPRTELPVVFRETEVHSDCKGPLHP